jgi:hypothetical protein
MDVKEAGRQAVDWTYLAQDGDKWPAVVNTVMNHHKYIHTSNCAIITFDDI